MAGASSSYRDYSRVPDEANQCFSLIINKGMTSTKEPKFPVKLHAILSSPEYQGVISWLPHGRSWRIIDQKKFEILVIPRFFHHNKFASFARQVNGWGFRRITKGNDSNSYYHELFLRGKSHLCHKMKRLTAKDLSTCKKSDDGTSPDFNEISRNNPLPESVQTHMKASGLEIPADIEDNLRCARLTSQINFIQFHQNAYYQALNSMCVASLNMKDLIPARHRLSATSACSAFGRMPPFESTAEVYMSPAAVFPETLNAGSPSGEVRLPHFMVTAATRRRY